MVIVTSCIGFSVNAQQSIVETLKPANIATKYLNKKIDHMPIATVGPVTQTYLYNGIQGFDIYKSQPDNMPIIKLDASFFDNMIGSNLRNNINPDFIKALITFSNATSEPKYQFLEPKAKDLTLPKDFFENYKPKY